MEPTGWICVYARAVPVSEKRGRQLRDPSTREENASPTMTVRSHSKASKPSGASLIEVKKLS
jgi:hypothetical protein